MDEMMSALVTLQGVLYGGKWESRGYRVLCMYPVEWNAALQILVNTYPQQRANQRYTFSYLWRPLWVELKMHWYSSSQLRSEDEHPVV